MANPYFFLMPGVGVGVDREGDRHVFPIVGSSRRLSRIIEVSADLIRGKQVAADLDPGVWQDAINLFEIWVDMDPDRPTCKLGSPKPQKKPGEFASLGKVTVDVDGIRNHEIRTSFDHLETKLKELGCVLADDEAPSGSTPVNHLPFLRHPVLKSSEFGIIGEGKGLSSEVARRGAICEGIERVLSYRPAYDRVITGMTAAELKKNKWQIPFIEAGLRDCFSDSLATDWIEGRMYPNKPSLLPAELVWFDYNPQSGFRTFNMRHTIGLAAGSCEEDAIANGLLECIERDVYALVMRCRIKCPSVSTEDLEACGSGVEDLITILKKHGIEVHIKWINLDYPIPVAHVLLRDKHGRIPAHSHGCSASLKPTYAIERALCEAVQVHHGLARCAELEWEKMASRIETYHSHPRLAWGDPLYYPRLKHLAHEPNDQTTSWSCSCDTIIELIENIKNNGRRVYWAKLGEIGSISTYRVFVEKSVLPDGRHEDCSERLQQWLQKLRLPSPYTDPILF